MFNQYLNTYYLIGDLANYVQYLKIIHVVCVCIYMSVFLFIAQNRLHYVYICVLCTLIIFIHNPFSCSCSPASFPLLK